MHPKRGYELEKRWAWLFWLLVILAVSRWLAEVIEATVADYTFM